MGNKSTKPKMISYQIKCRFCGAETGVIEIAESKIPEGVELNDAFFKIDDSRCSDCEQSNGSYKEMHDLFMNSHGSRFDDFKNLVDSSERNSKKFIKNVMKFCPEKIYDHKGQFPKLDECRHDIETELGIRDLEHHEKFRIVKNSQMEGSKIKTEKEKVEQEKAKKK